MVGHYRGRRSGFTQLTPTALIAWMTRLGLNKVEASAALGIARTTLDRYLSGETTIPRYIALACAAVEKGLPPIR